MLTYDSYPLPIAKHLIDEGEEVIVGIIDSRDDLKIPGVKEDEEAADRKERLSNYDGILRKRSMQEVIRKLEKVPDREKDDYFFFFDFNDTYNIAQSILAMGFENGLFPTEQDYRMEKDRQMAKEFVKQHYKRLKLAEYETFKKIGEGIAYLKDQDEVFVLKSNGNEGKTIVPKTDDPKIGQAEIVETLEQFRKEYEKNGFLLEKKIKDCLEVTPVIVFYEGHPIYSIVEIENKHIGAGNIGAQKGGNQVVSIRTDLHCDMNNIAFPSIIYQMAKERPGLSIYDAGLLYDGKDFYFTEFASGRFGWDGIFSEMVMRDEGSPFVNDYFEDIVHRITPLSKKYGVSVRLFNLTTDLEDTSDPISGLPMTWDKTIDNYLFLYHAKKEEGRIVTTADQDFVAVVTGAADNLKKAVELTYDRINKFNFEALYHRPLFDFLSTEYRSSIPNRIAAIEEFL